jgi:outer membrane cobalamin receptor
LVDGRPAITADTGGANWSLLPMDVVERVEVVKGALSPLYGSTAMGGVVNFITKSPIDTRNTRLNVGWGCFGTQPEWMRYTDLGSPSARKGKDKDERSCFRDMGLVHLDSYRNLGYVLSLGGKTSDGYRQNTDFSLYNAYGKMQYVGERDLELGLSLGRTWLERGYPHIWLSRNHPLEIAHEKTNDRQKKQVWDLSVFMRSPINSRSKLTANLYHFENYSESLFNPDDLEGDDRPYGFSTDSDAKKTGALLQMDISRLSVFPFSRFHYLILGLDAQIDAVDSNPADVMFGKHQAETVAGFAQDRIMVSDAFTIMLGARYDYRHLAESSNEGQVSPKLGLLYQVDDDIALRLSLGQAFRAPSLAELYMKKEIHSGIRFRQNPDLRSEKLRLYAEIGANYRLSSFLKTDTSLFIYDFSDMIYWDRLSEGEYQAINLSRSVIKGIETGVNVSWRGLSTTANYTYLDAQDRTKGRTDDELPYKPKHSAYAALDYQYIRFRFGVSLRYVSEIEEVVFYPNDAPDAFYTVNVKLSYDLSDRVKLSVAINNLLDRQYEEMARYRMPGRSVGFRMSAEQ